MTVFEDLIVELKEENLLEETVISIDESAPAGMFALQPAEEHDFAELIEPSNAQTADLEDDNARKQANRKAVSQLNAIVEQMSTFQTVEHILSSIQGPGSGKGGGYDELAAKKALHAAQQASSDPESPEFENAVEELRSQVAIWQSSLAARDESISVGTMRKYCETCQPALSAQALFSLARFNRSNAFTEGSRRKYEFVVTRLFSRPAEDHKRTPICSREEMLSHLRSRFSDSFESYSRLYSGPVDIAPFVTQLDQFSAEAEQVLNLDQWLNSDFFDRLNDFKETTREHFFISDVTAAAMTCNIIVLNKLADLVLEMRTSGDVSHLPGKYASESDSISNAIARTLDLSTLIGDDDEEEAEVDVEEISAPRPADNDRIDRELVERRRTVSQQKPKKAARQKSFLSGVAQANKWLLVATVLSVALSIALYFWADRYADTSEVATSVQKVDMINSEFKDLLKEGRVSSETFYAITQPAWDGLPRETQEQAIQKIFNAYSQKGCKRVSLINNRGQAVAFASASRVEVFRQ